LGETHPARGGRRELLVVAQRRDFEPRALRRPEDRLADDRGDFFAVDPDRARRLSAWDLADMRHRRDLRLARLRVPLEQAHAIPTLSIVVAFARSGPGWGGRLRLGVLACSPSRPPLRPPRNASITAEPWSRSGGTAQGGSFLPGTAILEWEFGSRRGTRASACAG